MIAQKGNAEFKRRYVIAPGKIGNPARNKGSTAEFKVIVEQVVHCPQDYELEKQGQTAAHRIVAYFLVQLCCFLLHLLGVVLVLCLHFLHAGRKLLHLKGSLGTFCRQREHSELKQGRHNDDGKAPVRNNLVEQFHNELKDYLQPVQNAGSLQALVVVLAFNSPAVICRNIVLLKLFFASRTNIHIVAVAGFCAVNRQAAHTQLCICVIIHFSLGRIGNRRLHYRRVHRVCQNNKILAA